MNTENAAAVAGVPGSGAVVDEIQAAFQAVPDCESLAEMVDRYPNFLPPCHSVYERMVHARECYRNSLRAASKHVAAEACGVPHCTQLRALFDHLLRASHETSQHGACPFDGSTFSRRLPVIIVVALRPPHTWTLSRPFHLQM